MTHVVVVGAYGSAGVAAADHLADEPDVELTLVDDGDPGGGLCILRGCMPSKEVLSAAGHRYQARHDHRVDGTPDVDLDAVVATKDQHTASFAEHRRQAVHDLAERDDVAFLQETARFVDDRVLVAGDRRLEPDYVVVATGSTVNLPDLPGLDDVDPMTSADVLDATEFPDSGVVMGFGYVGLELVPYLAEAGGTDVTVVEHDERPLDGADPAFGDTLLDIYRDHFDIDVLTETSEQRVESTDDGVRLTVADEAGTEQVIQADELFCFTGREPALAGLGLEHTRLSPGEGWVRGTMQVVDDDRVFAVGDVNGREPVLHVAKEEGRTAAENILAHRDGGSLTEYENRHRRVMFSGLGVYPYIRVGHTAETAAEAGYDFVAPTREASDDGVFKTKGVPEGLARLVVDRDDGTILGYQGLHYHADAMAKLLHVLVAQEQDVWSVPDRAYHPTTPEIIDGLLREAKVELRE